LLGQPALRHLLESTPELLPMQLPKKVQRLRNAPAAPQARVRTAKLRQQEPEWTAPRQAGRPLTVQAGSLKLDPIPGSVLWQPKLRPSGRRHSSFRQTLLSPFHLA